MCLLGANTYKNLPEIQMEILKSERYQVKMPDGSTAPLTEHKKICKLAKANNNRTELVIEFTSQVVFSGIELTLG